MEQLLSPLVVYTSPEHDELRDIARECLTKHHAHHYLGFAATQWKLFEKESPPRVKPLLYVYRVLLTGIHLMNTGVVEANLILLNEVANLSHVSDLIARKVEGNESATLRQADIEFHQQEFLRLTKELEDAHERSRLPESAHGTAALNDLLVRVRIGERSTLPR
jgi:predicted nucleotidyltransferase